MKLAIIADEPSERFAIATPNVPHSRTPFDFCHHLRSAEADASCPCKYRGGIWSKPDDTILFEMGQTAVFIDGKPEKMLAEADRLTQIADAHFIVRACNAFDEMHAALQSVRVSVGWQHMSSETRNLVIDALTKAEVRS